MKDEFSGTTFARHLQLLNQHVTCKLKSEIQQGVGGDTEKQLGRLMKMSYDKFSCLFSLYFSTAKNFHYYGKNFVPKCGSQLHFGGLGFDSVNISNIESQKSELNLLNMKVVKFLKKNYGIYEKR